VTTHQNKTNACVKQHPQTPKKGRDLRAALDAVLAGEAPKKGVPSIGCNIKWAPSKEPDYYRTQQVKK
jgi:hypothetical protein